MSSSATRPRMRSPSFSMISPPSTSGVISMPSSVPQSYSVMIAVLRHVDQAAGQVARVRGLERGVGQTLARAVRRDEVLEHRETFAEVRGDRGLDDLARRLGHQAAHAGQLTNLLRRAAGARVGHDEDRVEGRAAPLLAGLVVGPSSSVPISLHHLFGDLLRHLRPDVDDLVVALAVGDETFGVLVLDLLHFLLRRLEQLGFLRAGSSCPRCRSRCRPWSRRCSPSVRSGRRAEPSPSGRQAR